MSAATEKILFAEETVAGLQSQLRTVETVLETAEQVVATGEKAGRCLRRAFSVLLVISVVAAIALIVKKVMGGRCSMSGDSASDSESVPAVAASDVGDEASADEEASASGEADAS